MGAIACTNHPDQDATATCNQCLREFCALCLLLEKTDQLCKTCIKSLRRQRAILRTSLGFSVAAAIGFAGWQLTKTPSQDPPNGAALRQPMPVDAPELKVQDCNRSSIVERADQLLSDDHYQEAINLCNAFFAKCGEHLELRRITHAAYQQLSEWDKSITEINKLIVAKPYDKDYRV